MKVMRNMVRQSEEEGDDENNRIIEFSNAFFNI